MTATNGLAALIRRPHSAHCQQCVQSWPSATAEGAQLLADEHRRRSGHPVGVVTETLRWQDTSVPVPAQAVRR